MKRQNSHQISQVSSLKYLRSYTPIPTKFDTNVSSLLNLAAKVVAESIPYELIERSRQPVIPDLLQHKIIFYSFPRKEQDIYIYSSYGFLDKSSDSNKKLSFYQGVSLLEKNSVQNVMQIGFHLNGIVQDINSKSSLVARKSENTQSYYVSVTFDRCKITSVNCTCSHQGLFWCPHIVALTLYRIRRPDSVQFREPISESLVKMDRDQLQKFAQYLIASHPNQVLSSAQHLVDQLLETDSKINQIYGAPDPTAGAGLAEPEPQWHLNESQIRDQVSHQLGSVSVSEVPSGLTAMCGKVREMLRHQDNNGARLLALLTDQCLQDSRLSIFRARQAEMWPSYRELWDELARLWVCILLCPPLELSNCDLSEHRHKWRVKLTEWSQQDNCPPEDWDYGNITSTAISSSSSSSSASSATITTDMWWYQPCTVFRLPLIASEMSWDNTQLQDIIHDKNSLQQPHIWSEQIQLSCLRVLALRSNGLHDEAIRLTLAISRYLISQRRQLVTSATYSSPLSPPPPPPISSSSHNEVTNIKSVSSLCILAAKAHHNHHQHHQYYYEQPPPPFFQSNQSPLITHTASTTTTNNMLPPPAPPPSSIPLPSTLHLQHHHQQHHSHQHPNSNTHHSQNNRNTNQYLTHNNFHLPHQTSIPPSPPPPATLPIMSNLSDYPESAGWLGLAGNPVRVLTECLLSVTSPITINNTGLDSSTTCQSLGLRIALLALCQPRSMPHSRHSQERCLHHESRLLTLLATLPRHDTELCRTLQHVITNELSTSTYLSALSPLVPQNAYPMHATANFIFKWLLLFDQDLAYTLVKRAMRLPLLENHSDHNINNTTSSSSSSSSPQHVYHQSHHHRQPQQHNQQRENTTTTGTTTRWPVLRRIESAQCELALTMIQAARDSSHRLDQVLRICDRHIHSSTSLFKLSQDVCAKSFMNPGLRCAVLQLALNVAGRTLRRSHWRRREMVQWLVGCAASAGPAGLLYLAGQWRHYVSAKEAVLQVASPLLSGATNTTAGGVSTTACTPSNNDVVQASLAAAHDERVRRHIRRMAVDAASKDPVHCGMRALSLSEKDPALFEAAYQAIYDAAERGALGPQELFSLGRYLEPRGRRRQAYQLSLLAVSSLCASDLGSNTTSHATSSSLARPSTHVLHHHHHHHHHHLMFDQRHLSPGTELDIAWACSLAQGLGVDALSEMLGQLVRRVRCPLLLAEVLHRCRLQPVDTSNCNTANVGSSAVGSATNSTKMCLPLTEPPLLLLLNATVDAFLSSTHTRLTNISPRHYNDFLDFLYKARDVFHLIVPGGNSKFRQLIYNIRYSHRGKKKLNLLLKERFLYHDDSINITPSHISSVS